MALTNRQPPRIGLFGGSFNPPHRAHRALAALACQQLDLDRLIVMPAGRPWQKEGQQGYAIAPGADRLAMTRLQMQGLAPVEVSELELQDPEPSTSWGTLQRLQQCHPGAQWWLVMGQDQYGRLSTWKHVDALLGACSLAVAARAGQAVTADPALPPHRMQVLALPADAVSATKIRAALSRGEDITPMVGPEVAGYIAQHPLNGA
ncbi:nicotinate-nucleotide adenylyltransferase [Inhella inkyongensis]|uniref:Probable nicotinate-nucleotide adenylyltransferase n=1 Tax=Inhella inkyongensis TaxID=392593 RepID=A0A840S745_9BURK|nr:nicotinate (nicotinamide) nucleotide adenylyltransferase [Inhella inkyongensis]MBB5205432.1 nicotinate-nucleotide adenylyltransferase [Inhella inkyongensis]